MGGCQSLSSNQYKNSRKLDKELLSDRKKKRSEIKILLLGAGESGKSTVFKQLKLISGDFTKDERESYKLIIYGNYITQMKVLISAAVDLGISIDTANTEYAALVTQSAPAGEVWTKQIADAIKALWADRGIQETFKHRHTDFQINESAEYFFNDMSRICQNDYVPTNEDILRARVRSTGIEEACFTFEDTPFRFLDVGGQRSERRKWMNCFDNVTCVIFCVSLGEYDMTLREDDTQNRMTESLSLFEEMTNQPIFKHINFILFLNKTDIFEEKIKTVPLSTCFENYTGGDDFEAAKTFVAARFLERNHAPHEVFLHYTCALKTDNIRFVFNAVRHTVLTKVVTTNFTI